MEGHGRTGFYSYLETGEFTPDFISDVDMMIQKVFRGWSLYETLDEFRASCWAKIVNSMRIYEEQDGRSTGPVSTYLYQVIMNEARRIYSKHRKMVLEDASDILERRSGSGRVSEKGFGSGGDLELRDRICSFARMAFGMGVCVDQEVLYRNYCSGFESAAVRAFKWASILGGGKNNF
jgi:hypothetical protein